MEFPELKRYLDEAEKEFLQADEQRFTCNLNTRGFTVEKKNALEKILQGNPLVQITGFRNQREENVTIGRATEITFNVDFLLSERPELLEIKKSWQDSIAASAQLNVKGFLAQHHRYCHKKYHLLYDVVYVLDYLLAHPELVQGLYPRQIPHGRSTKLIGHEALLLQLFRFHFNFPGSVGWDAFYDQFRLRKKPLSFEFLADEIQYEGSLLRDFHGKLSEIDCNRWNLNNFQAVLIVENEESFFPLRGLLSNTIILWGSGKMIGGGKFLRDLFQCPIFYWGDIDKEGLDALFSAQEFMPDIIPVCMSMKTIWNYRRLAGSTESVSVNRTLFPFLAREYSHVCKFGLRIEQEQIDINDVIAEIQNRLST